MQEPINFYLDKNSIEIMNKLEEINKNYQRLVGEIKNKDKFFQSEEDYSFERVNINGRIRK